jgi:hypothetical protein
MKLNFINKIVFVFSFLLVNQTICADIRDLVKELNNLECIVYINDPSSSSDNNNKTLSNDNHFIPIIVSDASGRGDTSAPSTLTNESGLSSITPLATNTANNLANSISTSSALSPGAFFNHHANRFKSKIIPPSLLSSDKSSSNINNTGFNDNNNAINQVQINDDNGNMNTKVNYSASINSWQTVKNNLVVMANAAAVELFFLCLKDEQDAEKLCTKCSERFLSIFTLKQAVIQAPIIASCIQVSFFKFYYNRKQQTHLNF